jgi:AraC-like DNA-binding protein
MLPSYVLSVVIDGRGRYRHPDGHEQSIAPGTITIVHPGQPHWYGTRGGARWTELFAVFTGPLFDTLADVGLLPNVGPRKLRSFSSAAVLRTILQAPNQSQSDAEHQLLAIADWLVGTSGCEAGLSPAIATATERLTTDLTAKADLHAVAADVGLPYNTFRRRFTAEVGQSPLAYRNARRLQSAATLLRFTDMTLRQIAETLGFTDEYHVSRRFRAHFGQPPRDYRNA